MILCNFNGSTEINSARTRRFIWFGSGRLRVSSQVQRPYARQKWGPSWPRGEFPVKSTRFLRRFMKYATSKRRSPPDFVYRRRQKVNYGFIRGELRVFFNESLHSWTKPCPNFKNWSISPNPRKEALFLLFCCCCCHRKLWAAFFVETGARVRVLA